MCDGMIWHVYVYIIYIYIYNPAFHVAPADLVQCFQAQAQVAAIRGNIELLTIAQMVPSKASRKPKTKVCEPA